MSNLPKLFISPGVSENRTGILNGGINMVADLDKARMIQIILIVKSFSSISVMIPLMGICFEMGT